MNTFNTSMFDSIKDALTQEENNKSNYADILQLKIGNTYTVRILPDTKNPRATFFHYFSHGWNSFQTGKYVSAVSPTTFGERDPIAEERYKIIKLGSEEEKAKVAAIRRTEQWLVKVYVVDDPTKPENNGKVKVLRYGKQLDKIIKDGISGDYKDEYGAKIFELDSTGVNFKIKVEKQADYASYTSSRFTTVGADLKLSKEQREEIYNTDIDLTKVFKVKTQAELQQMFNEHYLCKVSSDEVTELPEEDKKLSNIVSKQPVQSVVSQQSDELTDSDIDELLKDL